MRVEVRPRPDLDENMTGVMPQASRDPATPRDAALHLAGPAPVEADEEEVVQRVSNTTKVLLGIGESVQGINAVTAGYYLNSFLLETACLDAGYVGLIQVIQGLWDTVNDPMIGIASDRTVTRWGRRRPWLLFAAPFLALSYFGLWNALPPHVPEFYRFLFALTACASTNTCITAVQVQIGALVPELSEDYDERTDISAWRLGISNILGLGCATFHHMLVMKPDWERPADGYRLSGMVFAGVLWACCWITFAGIREKFDLQEYREMLKQQKQQKQQQANENRQLLKVGCRKSSIFVDCRTVFTNKAFLCVATCYFCGPTAVVLIQSNLYMYCKYVLGNVGLIMVIMLCVQGVALLTLPLWVFVSRLLDKRLVYLLGGTVLVLCLWGVYFARRDWMIVALSCIVGLFLSILYLIPYSMLPDVIEEDALKTGQHREGVYAGYFTIMMKFSTTGAMALTNIALKASGYEAPEAVCGTGERPDVPDTQPEATINIIVFLTTIIPAGFITMGILCAWLFPITRLSKVRNHTTETSHEDSVSKDGTADATGGEVYAVEQAEAEQAQTEMANG